ncbi:twin-arginine translocation signal domain-containing protein [Salinibaculum rarum]|uniref:twin-arginine translocation signal domain-containing protein n=1 Tax=Salinibaculum rarum TaxID=3058903 RepID=UPI00265E17E8|nr:twin-arginine translocation signal domain-containing protein [Salinibaculum sp. KK48]
MSDESTGSGVQDLSRRDLLKLAAGAGVVGGSGALGWQFLQSGPDAPTETLPPEEARALAETYAPEVYFDSHEKWYPTDPRPYESDRDGETIVDGFTALNDYTKAAESSEQPPDPAVFYNAVAYEDSPLAVVQFWLYSAFDQFTTNFHWHDWEVLHVFHDRETEQPQLYVASAHGRSVPNNEFLDPEPSAQPRILTELASHSSGLSLNERADSFQRISLGGDIADITNLTVDGLESIGELPIAYGLPRDESFRLPYSVPELDGAPVYQDDRLPAVGQDSLVDDSLTVGDFSQLLSPPSGLPERETGQLFSFEGDGDVTYELLPTTELEHISEFTGPQLSFEFTIPEFAEDRIAGHITTAGTPWKDERYEKPAADITEPVHRAELARRYDAIAEPSGASRLVAAVGQTVQDTDAPDGEGVTTEEPTVETVALVESEPTAVPSFNGVIVAQDVPEGDHRLTVNGPGYAPHSEQVTVEERGPPTVAGVDGTIALPARENAVKLGVDTEGTDADLETLAVEDDFGGRLYDAPLDGPDAVYVDRNGAYTTEVVDSDGERGAFRVNPGEEESRTIERPDTGAASLAAFVADVSSETATSVRDAADIEGDSDDDYQGGQPDASGVKGLAQALEAASDAARRAAEQAQKGDRGGTDQRLETARARLADAAERLAEARGDLPETVGNAVEKRLEQGTRRARQAREAGKL